jgi:uncharacterized protein YjbJ (UPF0337 family)
VNWDQIKGDWTMLKGKVKERWGKLTDDELTTIAGKRTALQGAIQVRYGCAKERADRELDEFAEKLVR